MRTQFPERHQWLKPKGRILNTFTVNPYAAQRTKDELDHEHGANTKQSCKPNK